MCTLIVSRAPDGAWPCLLAANRDEMLARPWAPPAAHWPDQPDVVGGRDTLAGGTWLAVNGRGVAAGVLNRTGSLGPAPDKRSRGALPLLALRHGTAAEAAASCAALDAGEYRPFNLVIADAAAAFCVRGLGHGAPGMVALPDGIAMVTAADPNDRAHPRVARHLPRFEAAARPCPPDWGAWPALLGDTDGAWEATLHVPARGGFGTASSALIALRPGEAKFCFAASDGVFARI